MEPEKDMRIEINGTTYVLSTHYSDGEETVFEKIVRLVQGDEAVTGKTAF